MFAEMAKNQATDRPRDVPHGKRGQRQDRPRQWIERRKKQPVENKGGERAIDRKIVVLERCTYKAGCCEPNDGRCAHGRQYEGFAKSCLEVFIWNVDSIWRIRSLRVASAMVSMLDLERFRATPLTREPFEFLIVPEFVKTDARSAIHNDYPQVERPGSFPLGEVTYGSAFARLVEEMRSDEFRKAFEEKFGIDLTNRPNMITLRGRCSEKDGKIHTDSETKIITILIYMNAGWESAGGRLRLLRSANNLDDMILEVPPTEGTLLAFRRSDNSWHGHKPFSGPRRVIQFNWVTSEAVVRRDQNRHRFSAWMKKIRGALSGEEKAA
jgi:SM-20-related protein